MTKVVGDGIRKWEAKNCVHADGWDFRGARMYCPYCVNNNSCGETPEGGRRRGECLTERKLKKL